MRLSKFYVLAIMSVCLSSFAINAQTIINVGGSTGNGPAPTGGVWTDPALNHNRLLRDRLGEGVYTMVGTYKVIGTPFLFGAKHAGDVFTPTEKAFNIDLSYNTYNQEIDFYSTSNPTQPLTKMPGEVDSFVIRKDIEAGLMQDVKFVYGKVLGSKDKSYFEIVQQGEKYSLYKRYKADLGYVSTNYVQSELRQFDILVDYYYYNSATKELKKIKLNFDSMKKEFKGVKDPAGVVTQQSFNTNPEAAASQVIKYMNS
jgi:hypothetical protein